MTVIIVFASFLVVLGVVQTFRAVGHLRDDYYKEMVRRLLLQQALRGACSYLESAANVIRDSGECDPEDGEDADVRAKLREWRTVAGVE